MVADTRTLNRNQDPLIPYTFQATLSLKGAWLEGVGMHRWQLSVSSRKTSERGRHIPSCSLYCQIRQTVYGITKLSVELNWLPSHPPSFMANHILPLTASRLSARCRLHQIRKHLLHPQLHRHHVQRDILKVLVQTARHSTKPVHLFKLKHHAGIAGNECTDAEAKYQARQLGTSYADTGMPCADILVVTHSMTWPGLPLKGIPPLTQKMLRSSDPSAMKPQYFQSLQCMKARMHLDSKHKLGHASLKSTFYSYHQGFHSPRKYQRYILDDARSVFQDEDE